MARRPVPCPERLRLTVCGSVFSFLSLFLLFFHQGSGPVVCSSGTVFVIGASYQALFEVVVARCYLEYAAFVTEVADDGTVLCGVELVLPASSSCGGPSTVFFWVSVDAGASSAYEQEALQAISYLQTVYALLVVDYSFQGLVLYRWVACAAVSVGARAARLANLLCGPSDVVALPREEVVSQCRSFLSEVESLSVFV
ncbi:hypothetical protein BS78_K019200 [Paspalum vaginatum]|uniref:Uncharacterized protein n=1 Tax=Paspalum vaginatum TaxID=158149 RepID=A0A9W8CG73_9POAL|nr:hypothetical protein BS78_K019200 [Paspalum vaginatum]